MRKRRDGPEEKISTRNDFLVSEREDGIVILAPPQGAISHEKAMRLAAYLVALTDEKRFQQILRAVKP